MPFSIIRGDITQVNADAIVNAANSKLTPGGGVCGAIHKAAGRELAAECRSIGGCPTGEARITRGYALPAKYVIHAVGPIWGLTLHQEEKLYSCYINSLKLARENGCNSIAFPLISAGIYGCPKKIALTTAQNAIRDFLYENDCDMEVTLVLFERSAVELAEGLGREIKKYIYDNYAEAHSDLRTGGNTHESKGLFSSLRLPKANQDDDYNKALHSIEAEPFCAAALPKASLAEMLSDLDLSFSQKLLKLIDESGRTDAEVYKKANIDRKLFSKIRSDVSYRPKKQTALAFAIALELSLEETQELLKAAGYTLSRSSKADVIVEYFITSGRYDIYEINDALFAYDQQLIGC